MRLWMAAITSGRKEVPDGLARSFTAHLFLCRPASPLSLVVASRVPVRLKLMPYCVAQNLGCWLFLQAWSWFQKEISLGNPSTPSLITMTALSDVKT